MLGSTIACQLGYPVFSAGRCQVKDMHGMYWPPPKPKMLAGQNRKMSLLQATAGST